MHKVNWKWFQCNGACHFKKNEIRWSITIIDIYEKQITQGIYTSLQKISLNMSKGFIKPPFIISIVNPIIIFKMFPKILQ